MLLAQRLDLSEVLRRRYDDTSLALDGLDQERGRLRAVSVQGDLQVRAGAKFQLPPGRRTSRADVGQIGAVVVT